MAKRVVAAAASPLIGLAGAGAFDVPRRLFGAIVITEAVRAEVLAGGELPGARELVATIRDGWVEVVPTPHGGKTFPELGEGEASTIQYAMAHEDECLVVMDDLLGRARARDCGVSVTGLAGLLLAARQAGFIRSIRPYSDALDNSDFRISKAVIRAVLVAAGEAQV
jgi:predicted nucleic acid-binding protein